MFDTCALHKIIVTSEELYWWVTSYVIYIKRQSAYHIYNLIMPCFGKYIVIVIYQLFIERCSDDLITLTYIEYKVKQY